MKLHNHKSSNPDLWIGGFWGILGCAVYLLTMEPSVSFWDCGEFISTSWGLEVGHPPGAPFYQLLAHCFTLLAFENPERIAFWSNALSALSAGVTCSFLYWSIRNIEKLIALKRNNPEEEKSKKGILKFLPATIGTLCYLFCDTAWFSAVESEVYSLASLMAAIIFWAMLRWALEEDREKASRWIILEALLLGLGACVHLLTLLTIPALILIFILYHRKEWKGVLKSSPLMVMMFLAGISPYLIIPIRANADPPLNEGDPSTFKAFSDYFNRVQYEHAPLVWGRCYNSPVIGFEDGKPTYPKEMNGIFPRMWKKGHGDYYEAWCTHTGHTVDFNGTQAYKPSLLDNITFFGSYQFYYMWLRYLLWNYSGKFNDKQGYGSLQNGQFLTGFPPIDKLLLGVGKYPPKSISSQGHNVYFMLPFLMGIMGLIVLRKKQYGAYWIVMLLFLMGGPIEALYLNIPAYEPRERDYAFVLSFYAFAFFIAFGVQKICNSLEKKSSKKALATGLLLMGIPALMATQNWDDHNRSHRYIAHDVALNYLNSCKKDAILFTVGDNDTFPLWYIQQVEGKRTDIQIINLNLLSTDWYAKQISRQLHLQNSDILPEEEQNQGKTQRMMTLLINNQWVRPIYLSRYAYNDLKETFGENLKVRGAIYQLIPDGTLESSEIEGYLAMQNLQWHDITKVYIDETSEKFLLQYWENTLETIHHIQESPQMDDSRKEELSYKLIKKTLHDVPPQVLHNPEMKSRILLQLHQLNPLDPDAKLIQNQLEQEIKEQKNYYRNLNRNQRWLLSLSLQALSNAEENLNSIKRKTT